MNRRTFLAVAGAAGVKSVSAGEKPLLEAALIFPPDYLHNHGSCLVQCPNGDLLACWYRGSGERRSDDVRVLGARKKAGAKSWSQPFVLADTPGFPDCNPCVGLDPKGRLHLFWPLIVANEWHTAILMSKRSERYQGSGAPQWSYERPIVLKPDAEFTRLVHESVDRDLMAAARLPAEQQQAARAYLERRRANAADRYFNRMGWMPRVHPLVLESGRMLLPLYSDGFDFSLVALSDDAGETWRASRPILGAGPVQPALVPRKDGTLVAYMRDNGPPPKRVLMSESRDGGETWTPARDTEIFNPGAGLDAIRLMSGLWALVNNDTERGRHSLAVSLSEDEGKTWRWTRHLERDDTPAEPNTFGYPSLIQAKDGSLHCSYTYTLGPRDAKRDAEGRSLRECIKHARFNEAWIRSGTGK